MEDDTIAELKAQLEFHERLRVVDGPSGVELQITDISYDSELDVVVMEVEVPWH